MLGGQEIPKQKNSVNGNSFLRHGNRSTNAAPLLPEWSDVKMSDKDLYKGYTYAVIQKRGNKVATLARDNLKTWVKPEVLDVYQEHDATPTHPYLRLIEDSTKFTEKRFWKDISIYLDLAGVYYLGVVRNRIESHNKEKFPDLYSDPKEFIMLNPYEVHRIMNSEGTIAGYVERKKDGRERIWGTHQIIEMRELNPFDENDTWSMTDAAKESVYTLRQSGDYARQALNGNLDSPGILTTDVILEDEDFANFIERVRQHNRGEPLFGNGAGAINWTNTQVNLDQAALPSLNEIYRTTLFAVSGTSKTSLGIEQSGTTRETARVQNENFAQDTALPRLEDIIDFLNLDYKQKYRSDYDKTGYTIEVSSVSGTDYTTENQATAVRSAQFTLSQDIIYAGYTQESARQYAMGDIELTELKEQEMPQGGGFDGGNGDESNPPEPETPETPAQEEEPQEETAETVVELEPITEDEENALKELEGIEPHADLKENEAGSNPKDLEGLKETHICEEDAPEIGFYENRITEDDNKTLNEAYGKLLGEIRAIQKDAIDLSIENVTINSFEEKDLISGEQKGGLISRLANAFRNYWKLLVPLFGSALVGRRNNEFGADYSFKYTNDLDEIVNRNAEKVAEGHITTVFDDILEASNTAYNEVVEQEAAKLIVDGYKRTPEKYSSWFNEQPTVKQAIKAIRTTDILDRNRRIYERANRLAEAGLDRNSIVKAIRAEYTELSQKRAVTIARNETSRAFTHSQYDADYQFLNSIGKLENAYKELYSRSGNPCEYCQALINQGPIPFTKDFLEEGETITVEANGKVKSFTANYEAIKAGVVHVNCNCAYRLVFLDESGKVKDVYNSLWGEVPNSGDALANIWLSRHSNHTTKKEVNRSSKSGNFGHSGRPGKVGGSQKRGKGNNVEVKFAGSVGDIFERFPERKAEFEKVVAEYAEMGLTRGFTFTVSSYDVATEAEKGDFFAMGSFAGRTRTDTADGDTLVYVSRTLFEGTGQKHSFEKDGSTGFVDDSFEGVLRHELGHLLVTQYFLEESGIKEGDLSQDTWLRYNRQLLLGSDAKTPYLGGKWSQYASLNPAETIAEAFSNPDFSEDTRKVFDYVSKYKPKRGASNGAIVDGSKFYPCLGYPANEEILQKMLDTQKNKKTNGSSKSGCYGHSGRPGKVGGSAKRDEGTPSFEKTLEEEKESLYQDVSNLSNGELFDAEEDMMLGTDYPAEIQDAERRMGEKFDSYEQTQEQIDAMSDAFDGVYSEIAKARVESTTNEEILESTLDELIGDTDRRFEAPYGSSRDVMVDKITKVVDDNLAQLKSEIEEMGYSVRLDDSRISESKYFEVESKDGENYATARLADHESTGSGSPAEKYVFYETDYGQPRTIKETLSAFREAVLEMIDEELN